MSTIARAINATGQVAGDSIVADGTSRAFRTAPDRPIDPLADDLGTFADPRSQSDDRETSRARAINDRGQVAGLASAPGSAGHRAFRTAPDRPIDPATDDLGTLGGENSEAWGLNNAGEVVGEADVPPDRGRPATHAFLFASRGMIDLNACVELEAGWELVCALDINERGQIVAVARKEPPHSGLDSQRAYLLTPAPEPAPLAMLLLGTAVTGSGIALRWRRHARAGK